MPTVNQALKGRKIQKKFTKIHSSCVFFCPTYTFVLSESVQHDIDKLFSATRPGLYLVSGREGKAPPPPKFWTGVFQYNAVMASDNSRVVLACVWQGRGEVADTLPKILSPATCTALLLI